jgi:hypothetical protein
MRALGVLFVSVLVVAAVGWVRGWFGVQTSHATERDRVDVVVDRDKVAADAQLAADEVGEITGRVAEAVKRLARRIAGDESQLDGRVLSFDAGARRLRIVTDGGEAVELTLPAAVATDAAWAPGVCVRVTVVDRADRLTVTHVERL